MQRIFLKLFLVLVVSIVATGCAGMLRPHSKPADVPVDFYPGSATVIVKGVPPVALTWNVPVTTPGVFHFSEAGSDFKCEIRFIKGGYESKPVFLRTETERSSRTFFKLFNLFSKKDVLVIKPSRVFAIDKKEAQALGKIEPLVTALKSEVEWVRADAAEALGNIGNKEAVEPLIVASKDKAPEVRKNVAEALGKMQDARVIEPLIAMLKDKEHDVVIAAAGGLTTIEDPRAVQALTATSKNRIAALGSKELETRKQAFELLVVIGTPAVPSLIGILKKEGSGHKEESRLRCGYAALVLGEIGHGAEEAIPTIIESFPSLETEETVVIDGEDTPTFSDIKSLLQSKKTVSDRPVYSKGGINYSYLREPAYIMILPDEDLGEKFSIVTLKPWKQILEKALGKQIREGASVNDIPAVQALKSRYGKYVSVGSIMLYYAECLYTDYNKTDVIENVIIKYSLQSAAYSLNKLTGQDFGDDKATWSEWWEKNKTKY